MKNITESFHLPVNLNVNLIRIMACGYQRRWRRMRFFFPILYIFIFIRKLAKLHTQAHLRKIQFYPFYKHFLFIWWFPSIPCFIQESNDNIMLCLFEEKLFLPQHCRRISFLCLFWIESTDFFNPFKQNSSVWFSSFFILLYFTFISMLLVELLYWKDWILICL